MKRSQNLLAVLMLLAAPHAFADHNETKDDQEFDQALNEAVKMVDAQYAAKLAPPDISDLIPTPVGSPVPGSLAQGERRLLKIIADKSLPNSRIVVAIPAAQETFRQTYPEFPECAEKRYMEASFITRAWIDAGGSPESLPDIDPSIGYRNGPMEDALRYWLSRDAAVMPGDPPDMTLDVLTAGNRNQLARLEAQSKKEGWQERYDYANHESHGPIDAEVSAGLARIAVLSEGRARLQSQRRLYAEFLAEEKAWEEANPGIHKSR